MIDVKLFGGKWCGGCKTLVSTLEGKNFEYMDIEEQIELAAKYGVRNLPTLLFFKGDDLVARKVGLISVNEFDSILEKHNG